MRVVLESLLAMSVESKCQYSLCASKLGDTINGGLIPARVLLNTRKVITAR